MTYLGDLVPDVDQNLDPFKKATKRRSEILLVRYRVGGTGSSIREYDNSRRCQLRFRCSGILHDLGDCGNTLHLHSDGQPTVGGFAFLTSQG